MVNINTSNKKDAQRIIQKGLDIPTNEDLLVREDKKAHEAPYTIKNVKAKIQDTSSITPEVKGMIRSKIFKIMKDKVKNFTINVNKFVTSRTMIASNEMVNEFKSKTNAQAIAENILKDVTLVASGGAEIDIRQDTSAQLEMAAIVNIFSDDERKDGLSAKVIESLKSSLKNAPKFMNKIVQAGKIEEMAKRKGGFDKMIDHLVDKFSSMSKNSINSELENEINYTIFNENNFVDKIETEIKNSFKNMTEDGCLGSIKSRDMARKLTLIADSGAKIRVLPLAKVDSIAKCISTKKIGNRVLKINFQNPLMQAIQQKKDIFKVEDKKIVINKELLNDKQKTVLDFINKKGVYHIKINKKVLFKIFKLEEISSQKDFKKLNNKYNMIMAVSAMMLPQLLEVGLYTKIGQDNISIYLPQFMLEKEDLEKNINTFFELIKPKNLSDGGMSVLIKNIVIKFFTRLNRDNKGKHIFANMVDSIVKLGLSFFLPIVMKEFRRPNQMALLGNVEYFADFIIENMVTLVSDRCRLNSVRKDLLENGQMCTPKKLVDECPKCSKCPELKCPKPVCPTPNCPSCPEIPQPSCPEIPEIPKCPEIPEFPEIPAPICPKPNLNVYYGIIGALVLIVIIILLTRKSVTKIVKK